MSYPQAQSSKSVLKSQDYFRLFTHLDSNGDIYEIDTSLKGLVIGPNSDVQNVRAYYFDDQAPGHMENLLVSVSDPFLGRLDARMNEPYPVVGTTARILVTADDMVPHPDQTFAHPDYGPQPEDLIVWHRPYLDVLAYHSNPPAVPIARSERQWNHDVVLYTRAVGVPTSHYFFPHYRRKYFHVRFLNFAQVANLTYEIAGVTLFPTGAGAGAGEPWVAFTTLKAGAINVGLNSTTNTVFYSDRKEDLSNNALLHPIGYFDYMYLVIQAAADPLDPESTAVAFDVLSTDWAS